MAQATCSPSGLTTPSAVPSKAVTLSPSSRPSASSSPTTTNTLSSNTKPGASASPATGNTKPGNNQPANSTVLNINAVQEASIKGTVLINFGGRLIGIEGSKVTNILGADQWAVSGDGYGNYNKTGLISGTQVQLKAELLGFKTSITDIITLQPGENHKDITLETEPENSISGQVTDKNNQPIANLMVVALSQSNGTIDRVTPLDMTDSNGHYVLYGFDNLGLYTIKAIGNNSWTQPQYLQTTPQDIGVNFTKHFGQVEQRDFQVASPFDNSFSLTVRTVDPESATPNQEITGATVALIAGEKLSPLKLKEGISPVTFDKLQPGNYFLKLTKPGYDDETDGVVLANKNQIQTVEMTKDECLKVPQSAVKEFWFCGSLSKKLAKDSKYNSRWSIIDSTISSQRQSYGYHDLPQQVIIYHDQGEEAAFYSALPGCKAPVDRLNKPDLNAEALFITPELIQATDDSTTAEIVTHQWGHGKDWRSGGCSGVFRSDQRDFTALRRLAYLNLDTTLNNSPTDTSGDYTIPSQDNPSTFAFAFHTGVLYDSVFEEKIKNLKPTIQKALEGLVHISLIPEGGQ